MNNETKNKGGRPANRLMYDPCLWVETKMKGTPLYEDSPYLLDRIDDLTYIVWDAHNKIGVKYQGWGEHPEQHYSACSLVVALEGMTPAVFNRTIDRIRAKAEKVIPFAGKVIF